MPAVARAAPNSSTYFFSFWAALYCASASLENSPGSASLVKCQNSSSFLETPHVLEREAVDSPGVPSCDVCGNSSELRRRASGLVRAGQLLGPRLEVIVPAQPATVAGVQVLDNVGQVECLQRVSNAIAVSSGAVLAGSEVDVCDQVGQRVGLDEKGEGRVRVRLEDSRDCLRPCQRSQILCIHGWGKSHAQSMYSVLYRSSSPTASSPFEAFAAQSRPGRS